MRVSTITLIVAVAAACSRETTAPDPTVTPDFSTTITASSTGGASSTWIRDSIFQDGTGFIDCLGEDVRNWGEDLYILHQVTSASGVTQSFFQFSPITPGRSPISLLGLSSGRLYQLHDGLPVNQVFQFGPDSTFSYVEKDVYVNVTDRFDTVTFVFKSHVTLNANGKVTVDRSVSSGPVCSVGH